MPVAKIQPNGGWSSDLDAELLGNQFLNEVNNALVRNGAIGRAFPFEPVFGATLGLPRYLQPNQDQGASYWNYAADTLVGVTDGVTHKDITPLGYNDHAAFDQPFTGGIVNQRPVLNSLLDGPWWWDQDFSTPTIMQPLPGWPVGDVAQAMRPFREFLIAMNITTGGVSIPDLIRWSDAAPPGEVPQDWTASQTSQAGEVSISFNPGALVDGAQLLDRFYLYKTHSTYVMQLVGGVFVFNQRPAFGTSGILARGCVAEWRGQHIVLTDGDLVAHDGLNMKSLADDRLRREIFDNMDGEHFDNSFLVFSGSLNAVAICRPLVGETYPSEAILLMLDDLTFGHQGMISLGTPHLVDGLINTDSTVERNWDDKTTQWNTDNTRWGEAAFSRIENRFVMADYNGLALDVLGIGTGQEGQPVNTVIERTGLTLDQPQVRKFVRRVWPRFYGGIDNVIFVSIGAADQPGADPVYGPEQQFIIGTDRSLPVNIDGNFLAYKFRSGEGIDWSLASFELEFELMGLY